MLQPNDNNNNHNDHLNERSPTPRVSVWRGVIVIFIATALASLAVVTLAPTTTAGRHAVQIMLLIIFAVSTLTSLHLLSKWLLTPLQAFAGSSALNRDTPYPSLPANACDELVHLHQQLKTLVTTTHADNETQHAEAARLRLIVDHHPAALVSVDDRGFVSYLNPAAMTQLAIDNAADCIGKPITEITHHMLEDGRRYTLDNTPMAQAFQAGIRWQSQHEWFMDNRGDRFAVRYDIAPIVEHHRVLGAVLEFSPQSPQPDYDGHPDCAATNLPSHLEHLIARARRYHYVGALFLLQVNNLAEITARDGTDAAAALMRELTRRLRQTLRREDIVTGYRPNQLALCLPELAASSDAAGTYAHLVARQLLAALKPAILIGDMQMIPACSIGMTLFPERRESPDAVLRRADMALFECTADAPAYLFSQLASDFSDATHQLQQDLGLAVERGQLVVHFQRVVDTNGLTIGLEALLRWQHPQRGLLAPDLFLPLAANNRLILSLDQWMLQQAIALLGERQPEINRLQWISVNISELSLRQPFFADTIKRLCVDAGIATERLCLDLPPTVLAAERHSFSETLAALKRIGVSMALDDFGSQPIALTDLADCPVRFVKLSQRFLLDGSWERARDTVQMLLAVGALCGKTIIAEGVEHERLHRELADSGCHLFQGHAFGPPRALSQIPL